MENLPKNVIVPEGVVSKYLTVGKSYPVIDIKMEIEDDCLFVVRSDDGVYIDCKIHSCGHLGYNNDWIVEYA